MEIFSRIRRLITSLFFQDHIGKFNPRDTLAIMKRDIAHRRARLGFRDAARDNDSELAADWKRVEADGKRLFRKPENEQMRGF